MWSTFERIADWEIDAEDDLQFMLSRHAALICAQGGVIALDLSPRLSYYEPNGKYDLTQLYEYYDNIATRLGLQFDSRNGSDFCSKEYKELKMMNGIKV